MMLAHQQMGYDAARDIGEYDPGMDGLSISEDLRQLPTKSMEVYFPTSEAIRAVEA